MMMARMRTEDECLAKADDMDQQARCCGVGPVKTAYLSMAERWRYVARQARWQDARCYADIY
jgi:hypothetical protein